MRITCWNVNSINARLENVLNFLKTESPDIICLQELKCEDFKFPKEQIEDLGYNILIHGQKSYNGVAILSKYSIEEVKRGLDGDNEDLQSRYLEAIISHSSGAVRVACVYCPNGNPINTPKYDYKLSWMDRLKTRLQEILEFEDAFIVCGDWNIIPRPEDCYDPKAWENDALFLPETRAKYHELINLGLTDAFMALDGSAHQYTFWDYQAGAWPRNHGIHIDTHLLSAVAADKLKAIKIHRDERELPKASDHVPVSIELDFNI